MARQCDGNRYVDDILVASSSLEAEEFVVDTISKVVPTKTTGKIGSGDSGSLTFIGRTIKREKGHMKRFWGSIQTIWMTLFASMVW